MEYGYFRTLSNLNSPFYLDSKPPLLAISSPAVAGSTAQLTIPRPHLFHQEHICSLDRLKVDKNSHPLSVKPRHKPTATWPKNLLSVSLSQVQEVSGQSWSSGWSRHSRQNFSVRRWSLENEKLLRVLFFYFRIHIFNPFWHGWSWKANWKHS